MEASESLILRGLTIDWNDGFHHDYSSWIFAEV